MPTMPPGSQSSIAAHRYWLLIQEPTGRLRTTTPSKPRCNMMRTCARWVAAYGLPGDSSIGCRKAGTASPS